MGFIKLFLVSSVVLRLTNANSWSECEPGTCSFSYVAEKADCLVKADTRTFDYGEGHCNKRGMVIKDYNSDDIFCDCISSYYGDKCQNKYDKTYNCTHSDECNGGECVLSNCVQCPPGFRGVRCEIETRDFVDDGDWCENGGKPYIHGNSRGCQCPCGLKGDSCTEIASSAVSDSLCFMRMCNLHGFCNHDLKTDSGQCKCFYAYYGQFCQFEKSTTTTQTMTTILSTSTYDPTTTTTETILDKCSVSRPCLNGGTCVDRGIFGIVCTCRYGYYGRYCEKTSGNPCRNTFCLNGGTCVPSLDKTRATCSCPPFIYGEHCERGRIETTTSRRTTRPGRCSSYTTCTRDSDCQSNDKCVEDELCSFVCKYNADQGLSDSPSDDPAVEVILGVLIFILIVCVIICVLCRRYKLCCRKEHRGEVISVTQGTRPMGGANSRGNNTQDRLSTPTAPVLYTTSGHSPDNSAIITSQGTEGLPTYEEACEKPPTYQDVIQAYNYI